MTLETPLFLLCLALFYFGHEQWYKVHGKVLAIGGVVVFLLARHYGDIQLY